MALMINNNTAAFNSYRNLSSTQDSLGKSLEKLSSGFRINRAADDAAGLAISEGLRSQVGGLKQAVRNAQDGISVVQTAEGALNETHSILQRMRDLSVQAANDGGLSADAKTNIQKEVSQLKDELTRIADTTQFNGTKLLDGNYNGTFQVGANVGETIGFQLDTALSAAGLNVNNVDVSAAAAENGATGVVTDGTGASAESIAITAFADGAASADSFDGRVTWEGESFDLAQYDLSTSAGRDSLRDAMRSATGTNTITVDLTTAGDASNEAVLTIAAGANGDVATSFTKMSGASGAIKRLDAAISTVSASRAEMGAVQNRFDHTINNLNVAVENLAASESRIRDTDMAKEMVNFQRDQVLSQAGTAMLAQANQLPSSVMQLLR